MRRLIEGMSKCEYIGCKESSTRIVHSRDLDRVLVCCSTHADIVVEEQYPEYTDECKNCGCMQGVN